MVERVAHSSLLSLFDAKNHVAHLLHQETEERLNQPVRNNNGYLPCVQAGSGGALRMHDTHVLHIIVKPRGRGRHLNKDMVTDHDGSLGKTEAD